MKRVLRILGIALGVVLGVAALALVTFWGMARRRLGVHYDTHRVSLPVPWPLTEEEWATLKAGGATDDQRPTLATERAIARGKHLVDARYACTVCHGANFAGGVMIDQFPIATILGPNLTRGQGGLPSDYTLADWERIVRHGIKRDGTAALMPSDDFAAMSDHELSDIVSYISAQPAVDAVQPSPSLGPVGNALVVFGKLPLSAETLKDQHTHPVDEPEATNAMAFGEHLAVVCKGCHRADFSGGTVPFGPPDWPVAANLTQDASGLAGWSSADFQRLLKDGVNKAGRRMRAPMNDVVKGTRAMTDVEMNALWTYLQSLPRKPINP